MSLLSMVEETKNTGCHLFISKFDSVCFGAHNNLLFYVYHWHVNRSIKQIICHWKNT